MNKEICNEKLSYENKMVSVIIPTYNREKSITESVLSVLGQTYRNLELIIIDDGSTDNTESVLKEIKDERLIYVKQNNKGACVARNYGLDLAKGAYIALHDSDDTWHLDKLEKQMAIMQSTDADVVFCKYNRNEYGKEPQKAPTCYNEGFLNPVETVYGIGTQTLLAKRRVFEEFRFDVEMPRFQDLELLFRISKKYSIYCIDEALVEFNLGDSSISRKPYKLYKACVLLYKKHPEILSEYPKMSASFSNLLFIESSWLESGKKNKELKQKMYKLAYKFKPSLRTIFKIFLKYIYLYDFVERCRYPK